MEHANIDPRCDLCGPRDLFDLKNRTFVEDVIRNIETDLRADLTDGKLAVTEYSDKIRDCRKCYGSRIREADEKFLKESGIDPKSCYK
jgi:hypothetical protein